MGNIDKKRAVVLLALYNGEKYIEQQLRSLLNQTYKIDRVIIGDDGSTDNSLFIVNNFIAEHHLENEWFIERNENNLGHAGNFLHLCSLIEEDYVFFCDQDDIWMENKVESMINIMENNKEIEFLYADVINFSNIDYKNLDITESFNKSVEKISFSPENYWFKGLGCATCVRGNFVKKVLPYWTEGWEHDMFFWACSILKDGGYKYHCPVIYRRIHENNASIREKKTIEKRKKQVDMAVKRPDNLIAMLRNEKIENSEIINFLNKYKDVLIKRQKALHKKNPFILLPLLFTGTDCYLHKSKGVLADIYLILFK